MSNISFHSTPCPTICCEEIGPDLFYIHKEIDTSLVQFCIDGQVTKAETIKCRLQKTHMRTIDEIRHLQHCSFELEKQLACQIPDYREKIREKIRIRYTGPVRAKQVRIQYDRCNGMALNYDLFYVPC